MPSPYSCILFDLDGTIADSAQGITASLGYMFEKLGRPVPSQAELLTWVGPPILDSFAAIGMTPVESSHALAVYREHYLSHGTGASPIFPGVGDTLRSIHEAGVPLSLATSKPEFPASVILDHGHLTHYFRVLAGASIDEIRSAKADVVEEAIHRFRKIGVDVSNPVMVGDRLHDVEGAAANGIPTIFVNWGYGTDAEAEHAIARVDTAEELSALLLS